MPWVSSSENSIWDEVFVKYAPPATVVGTSMTKINSPSFICRRIRLARVFDSLLTSEYLVELAREGVWVSARFRAFIIGYSAGRAAV